MGDMVMDKRIIALNLYIILLVLSTTQINSLPPVSSEFYGNVSVNFTDAQPYTNVTAYDVNDTLCGSFIVFNTGYYGTFSCLGDDPFSNSDEGALFNESIYFFVNGSRAAMFGNNTWQSGSFHYVNISVAEYPPIFDHSLKNQSINESDPWYYDINCSDPNYWQNITYYDNATFFNISNTTGEISWTPGQFDVDLLISWGERHRAKSEPVPAEVAAPAPDQRN